MSGECVTLRELCARIAAAVGGAAPRVTLPNVVVRGAGRVLDAVAALRGRAPALSWEMALQATFAARLSSAKAARDIGYASRPLDESLRDAADWYRAQRVL